MPARTTQVHGADLTGSAPRLAPLPGPPFSSSPKCIQTFLLYIHSIRTSHPRSPERLHSSAVLMRETARGAARATARSPLVRREAEHAAPRLEARRRRGTNFRPAGGGDDRRSAFSSCGCRSPWRSVIARGACIRASPYGIARIAAIGPRLATSEHAAAVVVAGDITRSSRPHQPAQGGGTSCDAGLTSRHDVGP